MFRSFFFSSSSSDHFWSLNLKRFLDFSKIKVGDLRNLYHDVIVICFSILNFLLKFEYCKNQKNSLGETKKHFS